MTYKIHFEEMMKKNIFCKSCCSGKKRYEFTGESRYVKLGYLEILALSNLFCSLEQITVHFNRFDSFFFKIRYVKISIVSNTGTCGQDTASPPFSIFFFHFHGLEICKTAIICRFMIA
jgi:hypothetical protein